MLKSYIILFILIIFIAIDKKFCSANDINYIEHNKTMRIELKRQKSRFDQYLHLAEYGVKFPHFSKKHHKPHNSTNDSIALYRYLDNEFYGEIVIGHPGQKFNVAFDTTWIYTWIISSRCNGEADIGCSNHNKYDHDKSSEYEKDGTPFKMNVSGEVLQGFFSYDNISFAHSNTTNQSFIEMVKVPDDFALDKADGVMGLGRKVDGYVPFFYQLLMQNKINESLFSIFLNRDPQSKKGGNIMLGFVNDKHIHQDANTGVKEKITYLPLDKSPYWQFNMDRIIFDLKPKSAEIFCQKGCKAIVDTSSTSIWAPSKDVEFIHFTIQAKKLKMGKYSVNCDTVNKLPPINFVLQGKNFTLKGPDYITKTTNHSATFCLSAFKESPTNTSMWILGAAFLAKFYSIYDISNNRIGFVRAA